MNSAHHQEIDYDEECWQSHKVIDWSLNGTAHSPLNPPHQHPL